jgi:hypothetical protein
MNKPRAICVLGMHRSGTSCLTGSLQASGLYLGRHHTWNRYNQKGNRENQDFVDFHDQLLADCGGSWDAPPRKVVPTATQLAHARALVDGFRGHDPWGFKDPRALLALPVWHEVLPEAHYIGIFRHPLAVRDSLRRRDQRMSEATCIELWYRYNRELYREYRRRPFPLLCFDWDEATFHRRLNAVLRQLGLRPLGEDERFYTPELHNVSVKETRGLPWRVRRLYRKLQGACVEG